MCSGFSYRPVAGLVPGRRKLRPHSGSPGGHIGICGLCGGRVKVIFDSTGGFEQCKVHAGCTICGITATKDGLVFRELMLENSALEHEALFAHECLTDEEHNRRIAKGGFLARGFECLQSVVSGKMVKGTCDE